VAIWLAIRPQPELDDIQLQAASWAGSGRGGRGTARGGGQGDGRRGSDRRVRDGSEERNRARGRVVAGLPFAVPRDLLGLAGTPIKVNEPGRTGRNDLDPR
jgi:hypothetical protein